MMTIEGLYAVVMPVDLDLLRAFVVVYERQSVTAAAEALKITQPSVSYALNRLRTQVRDPLFTRTREGMRATPRARELYETARASIDAIDALVDPTLFDPAIATSRFRLALTDMGEYLYLPALMERLSLIAPGVSIEVVALDSRGIDDRIRRGEVDMAISSAPPSDRVWSEVLFIERYVCVAAHPAHASETPITAKELGTLRFAVIDASTGHHRAQATLARLVDRRASLQVPHLATLPATLARGGLAALMPLRIAREVVRDSRLTARELPKEFEPFEVSALALPPRHRTQPRGWFIDTVSRVVREVADA